MQHIDASGLDKLSKDLLKIAEGFPEKQRAFHEKMGLIAERELYSAIGSSGLTDSNNTVKRWQIKWLGTGGGYVVVRAASSKDGMQVGRKGKELMSTGANSAGAISNYLEHGHRHRRPGASKRYKSKVNSTKTRAFGFYQASNTRVEAIFIQEADKFKADIENQLGGRNG